MMYHADSGYPLGASSGLHGEGGLGLGGSRGQGQEDMDPHLVFVVVVVCWIRCVALLLLVVWTFGFLIIC